MTNHKTITISNEVLRIQNHSSGVTAQWERQTDESEEQWGRRSYELIMKSCEPWVESTKPEPRYTMEMFPNGLLGTRWRYSSWSPIGTVTLHKDENIEVSHETSDDCIDVAWLFEAYTHVPEECRKGPGHCNCGKRLSDSLEHCVCPTDAERWPESQMGGDGPWNNYGGEG